jgi:diadenosine tetraphosphatase ApaH/serine/threonine PP2A family protein phosphatase
VRGHVPVVCGHTHMPLDRLAGGRRFVNPGSVGMPDGPPGTLAYWALLGPEVTLRRSAYDLERAAAVLRRSAWPGTAELVEENVLHGPPATARRSPSSPGGPTSAARAEARPAPRSTALAARIWRTRRPAT